MVHNVSPINFNPVLFASPGGAAWFRQAVRMFPQQNCPVQNPNGMASDERYLPAEDIFGLAHNIFDSDVFHRNPGIASTAAQIFTNAVQNGGDNMLFGLNALGRNVRLLAPSYHSFGLNDPANSIIINVEKYPHINDGQSLRAFFLAILAANPAYAGKIRSIKPNDATVYVLETLTGSERTTVKQLVRMEMLAHTANTPKCYQTVEERIRLFESEDIAPHGALRRLINRSGLQMSDVPEAPFSRRKAISPEEIYALANKGYYHRNGIRIEYALIDSDTFKTVHPPCFVHNGRIFIDASQFANLASKGKTETMGYLALRSFAEMNFGSPHTATRAMLAYAYHDGTLTKLIDNLIAYMPNFFATEVVPCLGTFDGELKTSNQHGWYPALTAALIHRLDADQYILDQYRPTDCDNSSDRFLVRLLPRAAKSCIDAALVDLRVDLLNAILSYTPKPERSVAVQGILQAARIAANNAGKDISVAVHNNLRLPVDGEDADKIDLAIKDGADAAFSDLSRHAHSLLKFFTASPKRFSSLRRKVWRIPGDDSIELWNLARKLINSSAAFSSFRHYFMAMHLNWQPLSELPEAAQKLVALAREVVMEKFGGRLPKTHPNGGKHKYYNRAVIDRMLQTGRFSPSTKYPLWRLAEDIYSILDIKWDEEIITPLGKLKLSDAALSFFGSELKWKNDMPPHAKPLVQLARTKALQLFGGQIPSDHPLLWRDKALLEKFIVGETISFVSSSTPHQLFKKLKRFLTLERDGTEIIIGKETPAAFEDAFANFISSHYGWTPLMKVPMRSRALVYGLRRKLVRFFGGALPQRHPRDHEILGHAALLRFIQTGTIKFSSNYTGSDFIRDVHRIMGLDDGRWIQNKSSKKLPRPLELAISEALEFRDINEISENQRPLIEVLRRHVLDVFEGSRPMMVVNNKLIDCSPTLIKTLKTGEINLSAKYTALHFWDDVNRVLRTVRADNGLVSTGQLPSDLQRAYTSFIESVARWRPIEETPEQNREILILAREHMIKLFGGIMPTKHPVYGTRLGADSILYFLRTGIVSRNYRSNIDGFVKRLEKYIFSVGRLTKGSYIRKPLPAQFEEQTRTFKLAYANLN